MGRFYRVGEGNCIAGFLAIATAGLLVIGSGPIAFLRELYCLHTLPLLLIIDWCGPFQ